MNETSAPVPGIPTLTRQQMYEDFDYLTALIRDAYPRRVLKEKLLGIDMLEELRRQRSEIEGMGTTEGFVFLVHRALTLCQDGHTSICSAEYYEMMAALFESYKSHGCAESARAARLYVSMLQSAREQVKLDLPLVYLGGRYLLHAGFEHKGTFFPQGSRLVSVNGRPVDEAIAGFFDRILLDWDIDNKKPCTFFFYRDTAPSRPGAIELGFLDPAGEPIVGSFELSDRLTYRVRPSRPGDYERKVLYFPEHKLLAVRVPEMAADETALQDYRTQLAAARQKGEIRKVVLDIRSNPGGNDRCWKTLVGLIIRETAEIEKRLAFRECEHTRAYIEECVRQKGEYRTTKGRLPYLGDEEFVIASGTLRIDPIPDSIRYGGTIYVLLNGGVFSAAGSLARFANSHESFVTVGTRPYEAGFGFGPFIFTLPHSKLLLQMSTNLDVSNVTDVEGLLHKDVEVPVELPFEELIERMYSEEDLYSEEYLLNKDSVFKKVLELP